MTSQTFDKIKLLPSSIDYRSREYGNIGVKISRSSRLPVATSTTMQLDLSQPNRAFYTSNPAVSLHMPIQVYVQRFVLPA